MGKWASLQQYLESDDPEKDPALRVILENLRIPFLAAAMVWMRVSHTPCVKHLIPRVTLFKICGPYEMWDSLDDLVIGSVPMNLIKEIVGVPALPVFPSWP